MLRTILIFTLIVSFSGCIPDPRQVNIPQAPPSFALSSIKNSLMSDSSDLLILTKSFSALDNFDNLSSSQWVLEGADIVVKHGGNEHKYRKIGLGFYLANFPQNKGEEYLLEVRHPSFGGRVSYAKTLAHTQPVIIDLTVKAVKDFSLDKYEFSPKVHIGFSDNPDEHNYYVVQVEKFQPMLSEDIRGLLLNGQIPTNNFIRGGNDDGVFIHLIDDKDYFSDHKVVISDFTADLSILSNFLKDEDSLTVSLSEVSKEYFHYLTMKKKLADNKNNFLSDPFFLPTNLSFGYGYFTLHRPRYILRKVVRPK